MKKHVEKIRKWLGGAAEEHVVRRVAFWWLVYYQGNDLLTVKAEGEDITLQLKHRKCVPLGYESAPIERELAESLVGFKLNGDNWRLCIDGSGEPRVNAYDKRSPLGGFPVQPDKVRIVK